MRKGLKKEKKKMISTTMLCTRILFYFRDFDCEEVKIMKMSVSHPDTISTIPLGIASFLFLNFTFSKITMCVCVPLCLSVCMPLSVSSWVCVYLSCVSDQLSFFILVNWFILVFYLLCNKLIETSLFALILNRMSLSDTIFSPFQLLLNQRWHLFIT